MEENKQNVKKLNNNEAVIMGYLRANHLSAGTDARGNQCVKGSVTICINPYDSWRVRVYIPAVKKNKEANSNYTYAVEHLLPLNTVDMEHKFAETNGGEAADLKNLSSDDWLALAEQCTKVYMKGRIEEDYRVESDPTNPKGKRTSSYYNITASLGFTRSGKEFKPGVAVDLDGVILAKQENEDTQDVTLDYLWVDYHGVGHKFKLIAKNEPVISKKTGKPLGFTFAKFISENYDVNQTASLSCSVKNIKIEEKPKDDEENAGGWGETVEDVTTTTRFVNQIFITGGLSSHGIGPDESSQAYTVEEIRKALAARETAGVENAKRIAEYKAKHSSNSGMNAAFAKVADPSPAKNFSQVATPAASAKPAPVNSSIPDIDF